MASTLARPTLRQAMRPFTTRAFTTTIPRLDSSSSSSSPNPTVSRPEAKDSRPPRSSRPSRITLPNPTVADPAKITIWSPSTSLDLTQTIDRHIHFIHPILNFNSRGEPISARRPNLISAKTDDIVDTVTGDRYNILIKVERTPAERELNVDWQFDPKEEREKSVEQREKEEAEREERRQKIVRRRLAVWEPVVKGYKSSALIHAVRDAANDIHDELQSLLESEDEPEGEEFEKLVEKARELRVEHAKVLKELERKRVERAMLIKEKRAKLQEVEGKYDEVAKAKREYSAVKDKEAARAFTPKWVKKKTGDEELRKTKFE